MQIKKYRLNFSNLIRRETILEVKKMSLSLILDKLMGLQLNYQDLTILS